MASSHLFPERPERGQAIASLSVEVLHQQRAEDLLVMRLLVSRPYVRDRQEGAYGAVRVIDLRRPE